MKVRLAYMFKVLLGSSSLLLSGDYDLLEKEKSMLNDLQVLYFQNRRGLQEGSKTLSDHELLRYFCGSIVHTLHKRAIALHNADTAHDMEIVWNQLLKMEAGSF